MQPLPFGEKGVCKRNEKSTAGARSASAGASGDRLFFVKRADGATPLRQAAQGERAHTDRPPRGPG